ncbi:MAG: L,D-transpeptidase family protein, partial [Pseudomonadota bacterium]
KTPMFSDRIQYLEFNPTWTVPQSIAAKQKLPQIRKDPGYLNRNNFHLYAGWGSNAARLDPYSIDWSRITSARMNEFKLVQQPGANNALGRVKFMFPNKFAVYLHDTPARSLFTRSARAFSSGCVRLHHPMDFADYILSTTGNWSPGRIKSTVNSARRTVVNLNSPVPVHLTYFTAWTDPNGTPQFFPDIYDRDPLVDRILNGAV